MLESRDGRITLNDQYQDEAKKSVNNELVVLSLFDLTGSWSQPWAEAGLRCLYTYDIQRKSLCRGYN